MPPESPLRVAIVGAGPAGFYAAGRLLAAGGGVRVDVLDRLPTPFGLVRAGVAPDHPKIKSVVRVFEKTAAKPGFRFLGGVELGRDVHRSELRERYHAVLYAVGAATDRRLGIPGEDLPGSEAATAFVGWYNGHPDHPDREFDLDVERAVVIGNGNVALDCARMLALGSEELHASDAADHALDVLASATLREIVIAGRRGPAQAAFTNPELLELGELQLADVVVDPADVRLDPASQAWLDSGAADATARRNVEILRDYAARQPAGRARRIALRFCLSPVEIRGEGRVEEIVLERNRLEPGADGRIVAHPTGERETVPCGLVLRSIGYLGVPIPEVPFDERRGTVPNVAGRVVDGERHLTGEYVAGWIRRGPSGVIGTNKKCGQEAAASLLEDAAAGLLDAPARDDDLADLLGARGVHAVGWEGWRRIDEHETRRGESAGRPRVKLARYEELHAVARNGAGAADRSGDRS